MGGGSGDVGVGYGEAVGSKEVREVEGRLYSTFFFKLAAWVWAAMAVVTLMGAVFGESKGTSTMLSITVLPYAILAFTYYMLGYQKLRVTIEVEKPEGKLGKEE